MAIVLLIRAMIMGSSINAPEDYSSTNPWRDLPTDPDVHETLKEILLIRDTLRDGMLPTSLPDDDYDIYSAMLRSLESRTDLTWLVVQETDIDKTIMAIANRGGYHSPIPQEPHGLHGRAKKLFDHWRTLDASKDKPNRWEAGFDTTHLPPLLTERALESNRNTKPAKLELTPAQKAKADAKYKAYRKRRDRSVSYLKSNPPKPMALVPVHAGSDLRRCTWGTVLSDGMIRVGRKMFGGKFAGNPMFKPVYRDLATERVPYDWVDPSQPVEEYSEQDHLREMDAFREEARIKKERTDKQAAYQKQLRAEERRLRGDKGEL
ncbi:hypothetical protein CCHL11_06190 [Colletotrichum chlorophyti]|uniref:Uncharacterized protein n=1 Tax=Colletotrichum chlorophyti TaxID=708187 RepID=A0A1Q8RT32_9PEZI|nr:hypothetical protein CCHL11_06190 [Colletotrichum chlorophyti]